MATWDPIRRYAAREGGRAADEPAATRTVTLESGHRTIGEDGSSTSIEPLPGWFRCHTTMEEGGSTFAKPPSMMTAARGTRCHAAWEGAPEPSLV
ncbi:hypothetical protein GUJ93_ZPchr0005g15078 [Zizania palustris]|uniref:Uncharacterized protein n=1 Tax=Zizania palustris TaxID=103762 RepID=A0A8J5T8J3_ZIZPA|nr:hypothetical protein GUJ93_ZPchr0005g15078 [Zizania palustris]